MELAANQNHIIFPGIYIYIYVEPNQFHGHVLKNTCPVYILIKGLQFVLRATPCMNISNVFLFVYYKYYIIELWHLLLPHMAKPWMLMKLQMKSCWICFVVTAVTLGQKYKVDMYMEYYLDCKNLQNIYPIN